MRIGFLDPSNWDYTVASAYQVPMGGSQSAMCYLSEALAAAGHEVFLWNNTSDPGSWRGVTCLRLPVAQNPEIVGMLDVLVVLNQAGLGMKLRSLLAPETRLILWTQQVPALKAMRALAQPEEREVYDGFAFVSEWQRQQFHQMFGIDRDRSGILRNAIAPAFQHLFSPDEAVSDRQPFSLAYTSTPFRGLDLLLAAFVQIRSTIPAARLKVFSCHKVYQAAKDEDDFYYGRIYDKCRQTEGVEYIGSVPQTELAQQLRSVAVLAYPNTFEETSCIAVMEALASGCTVATSALAGLQETGSRFARLISVEDVQGFSTVRDWEFSQRSDWKAYQERFVKAVVGVLTEPEAHRETRLRQQVNYMNQHYTWTRRSQQWVQWLQGLPQKEEMAWVQAARSHLTCNRFEDARHCCYQAIARNPYWSGSYHILGDVLKTQGNAAAATRAHIQAWRQLDLESGEEGKLLG